MKRIGIFLLLSIVSINRLLAGEHFAKIEPLKSITIKAEANGEVLKSLKEREGEVVNGVIVQIDDRLNKKDLQSTLESLKLVEKMIDLNSKMVADLRKNMQKKKSLYERVAPLSSSSVSQKDALYAAYVAAKSQYSATLEKILNLKSQRVSLKQRIDLLRDTIEKKRVTVSNSYLYRLNVEAGEFVTVGMPLATVMNIQKGKLTLYLSADELEGIKQKQIYIDGNKSSATIKKIWRVADTKYISSYRVEIEVPNVKEFSKLVKVEFK